MSHDQVIQLISKPPDQRKNAEIEVILPWLRKISNLLAELNKDVLADVVRGCQYQKASKDEIIIKQGDKGDCFYIILRGLVSVYIDATMSGEDDINNRKQPQEQNQPESAKQGTGKQIQEQKETDSAIQKSGPDEENDKGDKDKPNNKQQQDGENSDCSSQTESSKTQNEPTTSNIGLGGFVRKARTLSNLAKKITHQQRQTKHLERKHLGKYIVRFEAGKSFGEIALLSEDNVRNASIITEEETDFLVIHRDLYNNTVKAFQAKEFEEIKEFIDNQPLFLNWPPKFIQLLQMSIRKETYGITTPIVTQGDDVDGLVFVVRGQAKLTMEPVKHGAQYPERWPFKDRYAVYEDDEFMRSRFVRKNSTKKYRKRSATLRQKQVAVRRKEGYAAAEQKIFKKTVELCWLDKGDIVGDIEMVMNLSTYPHSIVCTADTDVYILDAKNFERLITKKNPDTLDLLKDLVEIKLRTRVATSQGSQIALLRHLLFDLTYKTEEIVQKQAVVRNAKELPDKEILLQTLMDWFVRWRAPLIEPYVPGNVYYKGLMQERARIRANIRQQQLKMERRPTILPNTLRKQFSDRKPRSISILKEVIKKLKTSEVDKIIRPRRHFLYRSSDSLHLIDDDNEPRDISSTNKKSKTPPKVDELEPGGTVHTKQVAVNSQTETNNSADRVQETIQLNDEETVIETISRANSILRPLSQPSCTTEPLDANCTITEKPKTPDQQVFVTQNQTKHLFLPPIVEESKLESRAKQKSPVKETYLPPQGDNTLPVLNAGDQTGGAVSFSSKKASTRIRFYNAYIRHKLNTLEEDPDFKDFETSDQTLSFLENKMQKFLRRSDGFVSLSQSGFDDLGASQYKEAKLPKLKRFSCQNPALEAPRRGGRVMVKKAACKFANCQYQVKGHRHVKYHMVQELPEQPRYTDKSVKQTQMVMSLLMDNVLEKKAKATE